MEKGLKTKNAKRLGTVILFALLVGPAWSQTLPKADYAKLFQVGQFLAERALARTGRTDPENLLIITNAGYVRIQGKDSSPILDGLQKVTGPLWGRGNLLQLHTATDKPLFLFCYNAHSDQALYADFDEGKTKGDPEKPAGLTPLKEVLLEGFLAAQQSGKVDQWIKDNVLGGNEFRLFMITGAWKAGLPLGLRNSLLFHDHLCPGVTSGYYLAKYIQKHFPLSPGESYFFIASPVWCKDDALQMILNTTAGKRSLAVLPLPDSEKACLAEEAREAAGMLFRYHKKEKKGKGWILAFLWDTLRGDAGFQQGQKMLAADTVSLAQWMIAQEKDVEKYVRVIKEIPLPVGTAPEEWVRPGVNPWMKAGLWKCSPNP